MVDLLCTQEQCIFQLMVFTVRSYCHKLAVAFLRENVTATMNYSLVIFCLFCLIYLSIINNSPVSDVDGVYLITSGILDEPMVNSSYLQYLCTKNCTSLFCYRTSTVKKFYFRPRCNQFS